MSAREEILARIGRAHAAAPPTDLVYAEIDRGYRTTSGLGPDELVERLVERLLDYRALVRRCPPAELAGTVGAALRERGVDALVVPVGLDEGWLTGLAAEVALVRDEVDRPLPVEALDRAGGVLTGCALAIAETGTLVLDAGPGQGRRVLSLIPDYHLCVVLADQICADVPQAVAQVESTRPLTLVSGPSATSDIELNRVEGVHGPRTLEVIVVEPTATAAAILGR